MKRRLNRVYDHMTMPDRCAHRIEQQMTQQLEGKKQGNYMKTVLPVSVKRKGWVAAVAAVCLMLVLSVGGVVLFFRAAETMMDRPREVVPSFESSETGSEEIPEDYYAVATRMAASEVEAFAKIVRHNILEENWKALSDKIQYPISIQGLKVEDPWSFSEWMKDISLGENFMKAVSNESCTGMFCNWQGICMGDGQVWINEVGGELKVTAFNMEITEEAVETAHGKQIPEVFAEVLSGERIKMAGVTNKLTIEEYCTQKQGDVKLDTFAVVDMDGDNVCELVCSITDEQGVQCGYMVLRQVGNEICCYPFRPGELLDLKKDGTFFRRDRDHLLVFDDKTSWHMEEVKEQGEKPLAQWHCYPCQSPDLLLRSYEYVTGTGWSVFPGHPYYFFEGLAMERAGNAIEVLEYWMKNAACVQEENSVYILDPDAPGTAMYGTLTEEGGFVQFSEVGYYISTEEREYQAEIRNMLSEEPEYWVDVHLPFLGTMGRMVSTPEELAAYFGYTPMPDAETMQQTRELKALIDEMTAAYMAGGSEAMEPYLAETYQNREKKFFPKDAVIKLMTYSAMPEQVMEVGETLQAGAGIRLAGDDRDYSFNLELVKQKDGWKVEVYYLYISED